MIDLTVVNSEICEEAERAYPDECCGALFGQVLDGVKIISGIFPLANAREPGERHHRFVIEPDDVMKAERAAAKKGLEVLGFYHSHPDHPARPSAYDREHALPVWSYPIVSVVSGRAKGIMSWLLSDDRERFREEVIV
jgi:proteasome lid subunit RPN8/RPN11